VLIGTQEGEEQEQESEQDKAEDLLTLEAGWARGLRAGPWSGLGPGVRHGDQFPELPGVSL
jgi:hypothetical protein